MSLLRLQKYLSQCGVASRRHAEEMIREGRVRVNGVVVSEMGTQVDPAKDVIKVGNRVVHAAPRGILLLHKPRGVVSTLSDPEGRPTVADYLTTHYRSYFPVGRLDFDSSGLIVMTNDGELAERLLHPRYEFKRIYEVRVHGWVADETVEKLAQGVRLPDGMVKADVNIVGRDQDASTLLVTISEGRNRLVRRMMEKVGHDVKKLKRISHGPFKLGHLPPGGIQKLTEREYMRIREAVMNPEPGKKPGKHAGSRRFQKPRRERGIRGSGQTQRSHR